MNMGNGTDSNPFEENTSDITSPAFEYTNLNPVEDDHSGRNFVWLLLGVAVMVCGLLFAAALFFFQPDAQSLVGRYFPSPTATFTRTPTATPTVTLTPTNTSTPTPIPSPTMSLTPHVLLTPAQDEVVFKETFDTNERKWFGYFDGNTVLIKDGRLTLRSEDKGYIGIALCTTCPVLSDPFYYQAEVYTLADTDEAYGLAFCSRGFGSNYYVFQISPKHNNMELYKHSSVGWQTLIGARYSSSLNSFPGSNTLGVLFDHGDINLYINGINITSYEDNEPLECSKAGFFVNAGKLDVFADNVFAYMIKPASTPSP
jgi:hypothetical protein